MLKANTITSLCLAGLTALCAPALPAWAGTSNAHAYPAIGAPGWPGVYEGRLSCADCAGIQTRVVLKPNHRYVVKQTYLGKKARPRIAKGKFDFSGPDRQLIVLDTQDGGSLAFRVHDDALELVDNSTHQSLGDPARYVFPRKPG